MTRFALRTIAAILKGLAYIAGGLLFGALPLLIAITWKVLKGGTIATWKVVAWMLRSA